MASSLTAERLREVLHYDPDDGCFRWRLKTSRKVVVGAVAGYANKAGYVYVRIDGELHLAHRLAFLYLRGQWPERVVDHADGDPSNNEWRNLRECSETQNHANRKTVTGAVKFKGVYLCKKSKRFVARVKKHRKTHWIGSYPTAEEAHAAYVSAAEQHFGEFARAS